jgi:hypothetical protein
MAHITLDLVNEVWLELTALSPAQLSTHIQSFRTAQPVLAGYVRAVEEGVFASDERGHLTLYAVWAFTVCHRAGRARREIDEETIESMLAENEHLLHSIEAAPPTDVMSTAAAWTEKYQNLPLLGAMLHQAMQGNLEETRHVDDFLGLLTLHLKTIIDCLALD